MSLKNTLLLDSDKHLTAYTLAAAASAAMASTASADIIYSGDISYSIGQGTAQQFDLDGDGFNDITLANYVFTGGNYQGALVNFAPGYIAGFSAGSSGYLYVTKLGFGSVIGPATVGPGYFGSMAYGANNPNAQFNNVTGAYIGFSFPIGSLTDYGWIRVDINNAAGTFVVEDWAYNNSGGAIGAGVTAAPEPSSLGILALGAAGLGFYRHRRSATAK